MNSTNPPKADQPMRKSSSAESAPKAQVVKFTFKGLSPKASPADLPQPNARLTTHANAAPQAAATQAGTDSAAASRSTAAGALPAGSAGASGGRASTARAATERPASDERTPAGSASPGVSGVKFSEPMQFAPTSTASGSAAVTNASSARDSLPSHKPTTPGQAQAGDSSMSLAESSSFRPTADAASNGVGESSVRGDSRASSSRSQAPHVYAPGSWEPNQHSERYHFITFPNDPLPSSYIRSFIQDDDEAQQEFDSTAWYQATPEEVARDKERAVERERIKKEREEKELKRRQERGKNKLLVQQRDKDARGGGPRKAAKQRRKKVQREKRPRQIRPLTGAAIATKFGRVNANILFPDQDPFTLPLTNIPGYVDLDALPTSYRLDPRDELRPVGNDATAATTAAPSVDGHSAEATPGLGDGDGSAWPVKPSWERQSKPKSGPMKASDSTQSLVKRSREDELAKGNKRKKVGSQTPVPVPGSSPDDSNRPPPVSGPYNPNAVVHSYALQTTSCLSKRAYGCIQCYSCVARAVGHACCFQGIRFFPLTKEGLLAGPPEFRTPDEPDDKPQWRILPRMTPAIAGDLKARIAKHIFPTIEQEWKLATPNPAEEYEPVKIRSDLRALAVCDTCLVNMPSASWICESCGRESCDACRQALIEVEELEDADPDVGLSVEQSRRKKCIAKKRGSGGPAGWGHTSSQFVPLIRYSQQEMDKIYKSVKDALERKPKPWMDLGESLLKSCYYLFDPRQPREVQLKSSREVIKLTKYQVEDAQLGKQFFDALWARGEPMYISGACELPIPADWMPPALSKRFGEKPCELVQLSTQALTPSTFKQYFGSFGVPKLDPTQTYKLRDLASARDFAFNLPGLRQFYLDSLPVKDQIQINGMFNLAAHTPRNAVMPDLGPRLVSSYGGPDKLPNVGLTNLHREVADVANLMVYGAANPSQPLGDRPGCSRWDIFRAEDNAALTAYLCEELGKKSRQSGEQYAASHDDPVLSEVNYLSQDQLKALAKRSIIPHVVWQRPGDLVLVPAGCAYQVCNFADCLNISSEFLSVQSLPRSIALHELGHNQTKERSIWKHDPIQFKTQLFWVWQACDMLDS